MSGGRGRKGTGARDGTHPARDVTAGACGVRPALTGHTVIRCGPVAGRMADDRRTRDKQARDEDTRQRTRAMREAHERLDEAEPDAEEDEE